MVKYAYLPDTITELELLEARTNSRQKRPDMRTLEQLEAVDAHIRQAGQEGLVLKAKVGIVKEIPDVQARQRLGMFDHLGAGVSRDLDEVEGVDLVKRAERGDEPAGVDERVRT